MNYIEMVLERRPLVAALTLTVVSTLNACGPGIVTYDEGQREFAPTYIKASNAEADDRFGAGVALSADGATLAVGAVGEGSAATGIDGVAADNSMALAGAVYILGQDSDGVWGQRAYIKASNSDAGDNFGAVLALSADGATLAVGADGEDSFATGIDGVQSNNSRSSAGAVYVFTRDVDGVWSQQAYIKASNTNAEDRFGAALALSADGNTLAIGAVGEASAAAGIDFGEIDNTAAEAGAAYVFTRDVAGLWSQQAYIKASNTDAGDRFGAALALAEDGDVLAVGASAEAGGVSGIDAVQNDNSAAGAGAVYLFRRDGADQWAQETYIKAANVDAADGFGGSVSLSIDGALLAVGAAGEASAGSGINGDAADNSAPGAGAVYVFGRAGAGVWTQDAYVKASNSDGDDAFGCVVTLAADGSRLAVGAYGEASVADETDNSAVLAGAAYLFAPDATAIWLQERFVKADNADAGDRFAVSLAQSADGAALAVGADLEAGSIDNDDNSAQGAGAVYVFQ